MTGGDRDTAGKTGRGGRNTAPSGSSAADAGRAAEQAKWHYPGADEHPDQVIFIHEPWCKSCGICYSMCPRGVLTSDKAGRPTVSSPDECIVCGLCEILCPDMAITVHKKRKTAKGGASSDGTSEKGCSRESGDE